MPLEFSKQLTAHQTPIPGVVRWGLADFGIPELVTWILALAIAWLAMRRTSFSLATVAILVASPALHRHYLTLALVPLFGIWMPWLVARLRRRESEALRVADGPSVSP